MTYGRLFFVGVQFAVREEQGFGVVLVVMGERVESLGQVEAEDHHSDGANKGLLEWGSLQVRDLRRALPAHQVVLVLIKLLLHFSSEHFFFYYLFFCPAFPFGFLP